MTSKKMKPMQKLTNSCKKESHDRADLQGGRVEPMEQKASGFHRAQQSMELTTNLFKVSTVSSIVAVSDKSSKYLLQTIRN